MASGILSFKLGRTIGHVGTDQRDFSLSIQMSNCNSGGDKDAAASKSRHFPQRTPIRAPRVFLYPTERARGGFHPHEYDMPSSRERHLRRRRQTCSQYVRSR